MNDVLQFLWIFGGLIVVSAIMYALASFLFGRGEELEPMPADATPMVLPAQRALRAEDVRRVRLPVAFRGYRMSEVDELLDRLAEELDEARGAQAEPDSDENAPAAVDLEPVNIEPDEALDPNPDGEIQP